MPSPDGSWFRLKMLHFAQSGNAIRSISSRIILFHCAGKPDAKAQAAKAAKAVKKGSFKRTRTPRFSVVFHRPKTLKRSRDPKYTRVR